MSKARDLANAGTALGAVTATELGYVDGVTSAIQAQIDSKITGSSAIAPTIVDAKGDIIVATAADTVARLAVGANATVLTADSAEATGLKWAAGAAATEIFNISTTRKVIPLVALTAGDFTFVTNSGTASVFLYNSSNVLMNQISVTTTSQTVTIASNILRAEAQGSTTNTVAIFRNPTALASTTTADISLITTNGAWSSYNAGQYAHVVLIGGGGGGGGGYSPNRSNGGNGRTGSLAFNNSAIALTGSYNITIGTGGAGGNAGTPGNAGGAGNATNAFGLTANGSGGGNAGTFNENGTAGSAPAVGFPQDTQISKQQDSTLFGNNGAAGVPVGPNSAGNAGGNGAVLIYKWTP